MPERLPHPVLVRLGVSDHLLRRLAGLLPLAAVVQRGEPDEAKPLGPIVGMVVGGLDQEPFELLHHLARLSGLGPDQKGGDVRQLRWPRLHLGLLVGLFRHFGHGRAAYGWVPWTELILLPR